MSRRSLRLAASILIVVALGLLVVGLQADAPPIWLLGLAAVAGAMVLSLSTRWIGSGSEPPDAGGTEGGDSASDRRGPSR